MASGTYNLEINGLNNFCNQSSFDFYIPQPSEIHIDESITDVMTSVNDGSINLNISGGTAPYSILWNNNETSTDLENLPAGDYTVVVTDGNNCSATYLYTVNSQLSITDNKIEPSFIYLADQSVIVIHNIDKLTSKKITLYSINGAILKTYTLNKTNKQEQITIPSALSKGTYFLKNESGMLFKFVK